MTNEKTASRGRSRPHKTKKRRAIVAPRAARRVPPAARAVLLPDAVAKAYQPLLTDLTLAGFEAQRVVALRCAKLVRGGRPAMEEVRHMISEKILAFTESMTALALGGTPKGVVRRYHAIMQANTRRLSR